MYGLISNDINMKKITFEPLSSETCTEVILMGEMKDYT